MKKKLIMALAAVAMTAGFAAKADDCPRARQCDNNSRCETPCDDKTKCTTPACEVACPFADLGLTDAQKTQLKDLRSKQADARKAARKDDKQARRQARNECRRNELAEIKKILTPEQYVKFLENNYVDKSSAKPRAHHGDMKRMAPRKEQAAGKMRPAKRVAAATKVAEPAK